MKRFTFACFTALLLIAGTLALPAQVKYATFGMSHFGADKKYEIAVNFGDGKDNLGYVLIEAESKNKDAKPGVFIISKSGYAAFLREMRALKLIYDRWRQTAIDNKVTEFGKTCPYGILHLTTGFYNWEELHFSLRAKTSARFRVTDGKYQLTFETEQLKSITDEFIKSSGLELVFSSEKEFRDFIDKLDEQKIADFCVKMEEIDKLFR